MSIPSLVYFAIFNNHLKNSLPLEFEHSLCLGQMRASWVQITEVAESLKCLFKVVYQNFYSYWNRHTIELLVISILLFLLSSLLRCRIRSFLFILSNIFLCQRGGREEKRRLPLKCLINQILECILTVRVPPRTTNTTWHACLHAIVKQITTTLFCSKFYSRVLIYVLHLHGRSSFAEIKRDEQPSSIILWISEEASWIYVCWLHSCHVRSIWIVWPNCGPQRVWLFDNKNTGTLYFSNIWSTFLNQTNLCYN